MLHTIPHHIGILGFTVELRKRQPKENQRKGPKRIVNILLDRVTVFLGGKIS